MNVSYTSYSNESPLEYVTKDLSVIRELLNQHCVPGLGLSLAEAVVEAGHATEKHYHTAFDEIYYCLEGEGTLYINDQACEFAAHMFYLLPKNATHYLRAAARLRLLCICCPGYTHEQTVLVVKNTP